MRKKMFLWPLTYLRRPVWWHRKVRHTHTHLDGCNPPVRHDGPKWPLVSGSWACWFLAELLWEVLLVTRFHVSTSKLGLGVRVRVARCSDIASVCSGCSHRNTNPQRVAVAAPAVCRDAGSLQKKEKKLIKVLTKKRKEGREMVTSD